MSRFDELCAGYREVSRRYHDYRAGCFSLVDELLRGFREYLDAPEDVVSLFAKHGHLAGRKVDGPITALELRDDTFFHFGLVLDLYDEADYFPHHHVAFDLRLKRVQDRFLLHVDDGPAIEVPVEDSARRRTALELAYARLQTSVLDRYASTLEDFFDRGQANRRFGF